MPVGFKNGTDGSIQVALDAMRSALQPGQQTSEFASLNHAVSPRASAENPA